MSTLITFLAALGALAFVLWLIELGLDYLEARLSGRRKRPETSPSVSARVDRPQRSRPLSQDETVAHMTIWPTTGRRVRQR